MKSALRIPYKEVKFEYEWQYKELKYKSLQDLWTFEFKIYYLLTSWLGWDFDYQKDIKELWNNIKLFDLKLWQYLLEWDNKNDLVSTIESIEKDWIQIEGEFEFKNKYYFILYKPKINWEIAIEIDSVEDKIKDIL